MQFKLQKFNFFNWKGAFTKVLFLFRFFSETFLHSHFIPIYKSIQKFLFFLFSLLVTNFTLSQFFFHKTELHNPLFTTTKKSFLFLHRMITKQKKESSLWCLFRMIQQVCMSSCDSRCYMHKKLQFRNFSTLPHISTHTKENSFFKYNGLL